MSHIKVLICGPSSFISTIDELKSFLKFNYLSKKLNGNYDIILFHDEIINDKQLMKFINCNNSLKICATANKKISINCDAYLNLPTNIREINNIVENVIAKNKFNQNSSIKVKQYYLNKNEKKLSKNGAVIILTEKEIQLIELFLNTPGTLTKENILTAVWNYSSEADTHTVETHIYRLRKKVSDKFNDTNFIFNNKDGYSL